MVEVDISRTPTLNMEHTGQATATTSLNNEKTSNEIEKGSVAPTMPVVNNEVAEQRFVTGKKLAIIFTSVVGLVIWSGRC